MKFRSLGREYPLKEEMATHSSILAMDRGAWRATVWRVSKGWTQPSAHCTLGLIHGTVL